MLSASQLLKVTEDLVDRVDRCRDDRKELEQLVNTKTILDKRRGADGLLGGSSSSTLELQAMRNRLDAAITEAAARVHESEVAARLAAETPTQAAMREVMAGQTHKLSGIFARTDVDGDGMVTIMEFRAVLPVLNVDGATEADCDALFLNLSQGAHQMGYRDLFKGLTIKPKPPQPKAPTPRAGAATPPRKVTPRAASAGPKERPATPKGKAAPAPAKAEAKPEKKAAGGGKKAPAGRAASAQGAQVSRISMSAVEVRERRRAERDMDGFGAVERVRGDF